MALLCTEKTNIPYNDHFNIIKHGMAQAKRSPFLVIFDNKMGRNIIYNFELKSIHLAKVSFSERLPLLTM